MLKPNDEKEKDRTLELGFMILEKLWRQGFTSEVAARLMKHAGSRTVVAKVVPENTASLKVLEKLDFHVVKTEGGTVHLSANERPKV